MSIFPWLFDHPMAAPRSQAGCICRVLAVRRRQHRETVQRLLAEDLVDAMSIFLPSADSFLPPPRTTGTVRQSGTPPQSGGRRGITWLVLALLAARRLHRARLVGDRAAFRHQVVFLFCYLGSAAVIMAGWVLRNERLDTMGCLTTGIVIVCYALSRTAPLFFAQNRRFLRFGRKKPPWDASAPELTARLSRLMEQEAPYRDETLTLHRLAGMLGEESKRLSYHLNVNLSNTFRGYINELRPIAVCGDFLGNPRRAILDIAFSNGFNSKSSFSALFVRKYGQTSKEYRQKHLEHPDGTTRLSLENPRRC